VVDAAFLGTGWSFPLRFSPSGVALSVAEQDIEESLRILLSTRPGERVMDPHYGCDLRAFSFRVLDVTTITQIKDCITRAILFFEPRVRVEGIDVIYSEESSGLVRIDVGYVVNSTNTRYNLVYPFYLAEATDVIL